MHWLYYVIQLIKTSNISRQTFPYIWLLSEICVRGVFVLHLNVSISESCVRWFTTFIVRLFFSLNGSIHDNYIKIEYNIELQFSYIILNLKYYNLNLIYKFFKMILQWFSIIFEWLWWIFCNVFINFWQFMFLYYVMYHILCFSILF